MELRQRILDLYHQYSLSGLDVTLKLWYKGRSGVFHTHKFSSSLVRGFSVIRMEPGETKNTNSVSKPAEKDKEKKINLEACKWNNQSNFSAVPDLGACFSTAEAPRMVLSKERTSREGFSQ